MAACGGFVWLLAGTEGARWHNDASGLGEMFEEYLDEDAGPEQRREADLWRRGLQLDVESDATYVLPLPRSVVSPPAPRVRHSSGGRHRTSPSPPTPRATP